MSAYMVDDYHLNALVNWARAKRIVFHLPTGKELDATRDPDVIGDLLKRANEESVNARYRESDLAPPFRFRLDYRAAHLPALVILKAIACLDYQSCEFDGWQESAAYRILQRIQACAIRSLPGWDDSPGWSLSEVER